MHRKVELLKSYYNGMPTDRAKVETYEYGFPFLEATLIGGMALEYGEAASEGLLHKYKFSNIPADQMDALLLAHVRKACNVCLYFNDTANSLFCCNLDNNHKINNTEVIPEMAYAVKSLRSILAEAGCEPLVIASGRGYHLWCRLAAPAVNTLTYDLMVRATARCFLSMNRNGMDHRVIKANFYPDPRVQNIVSLRLFGSEHMRNKVFSRVLTGDRLLDEDKSWEAFQDHMRLDTISGPAFHMALEKMAEPV